MNERLRTLAVAAALAICLVAGSEPRIVGDGGEYLAQAMNFAGFNAPPISRRVIPSIEQRIAEIEPALGEWRIADAAVASSDRRRDFLHFWFYAFLATPGIWITSALGVSPIHAFTALNFVLLGTALYFGLPRLGKWTCVLLFASPLIWWLDKPHTELFTVSLVSIALLLMRERPWWALVASGMAATQNPPVTVVFLLILAVEIVRQKRAVLSDRRLLAGAAAGLALSLLAPVYTYARHGTPSLLLYATRSGMPTFTETAAVVADPSMGLIGNYPVFLAMVVLATVALLKRHPRDWFTSETFVALVSAMVFLYSFARTTNPHHGATPSLSRYALWLVPLAIPLFWSMNRLSGRRWRMATATAATVSAFISVIGFHPGVPQNSREPTWLATWLWTTHPGWNNPLAEIFSEVHLRVEGTTVPATTAGCEKVLIAGAPHDKGRWPVPCLPAEIPMACQVPGVLCYANRRGSAYDFKKAPGREGAGVPRADGSWPLAAEAHVRKIYADVRWWELTARGEGRVASLRASRDLRVASFGDDTKFMLVLSRRGPAPGLAFRSSGPMRGQLLDPLSGQVVQDLVYSGSPAETWNLDIPSAHDVLVLTMTTAGTSE